MRLSPLLSYKIDFLANLSDEYNQRFGKTVSVSFKTFPIAPKDRYLYSSRESRQTQVIPSSLPVVLGLLSVNTDSTNIDICELDQAEYLRFLGKQHS